MMLRILLALTSVLLFQLSTNGQVLSKKIDKSYANLKFQEFAQQYGEANKIRFFFLPDWVSGVSLRKDYTNETLKSLLDDLLADSEIDYVEMFGDAIILFKNVDNLLMFDKIIQSAKEAQKKISYLKIGDSTKYQLGQMVQIMGRVRESNGNEPVPSAVISIDGSEKYTVTNSNGDYHYNLKSGEHVIQIKHVNYEEQVLYIKLFSSDSVNLTLDERPSILEDVIVKDQSITNTITSTIGQISINLKELKRMPVLFGEVDIVKQIQILPGVSSSGDASTGFYVRGGGADQNLILYDGTPVFNTSHAFGFFSAFNAESIKDVTFYKGGIPAEFGGRVSSVLNVTSKEGDFDKWKGKTGIGPISAQLSLEGPIKKNASSLMISARSSYSDWVVKKFATKLSSIANSSVSFYDASLKWTTKISSKDKLTISAYKSFDNFRMPTDTAIAWESSLANLRYDHVFNDNVFLKITAGTGQFKYTVRDYDPETAYKLYYQINYPSIQTDLQIQRENHSFNMGLSSRFYQIKPGKLISLSEALKSKTLADQRSLESGIFISDDFKLNEVISIQAGLRYSVFNSLGPTTTYFYDPSQPRSVETIQDSVTYAKNKSAATYSGLEPRLSTNIRVGPNSTIKVGYNRMYQYLHLISNSLSVAPIDVWQSSNFYFKPQIGDQISIGYFKTIKDKTFQTSAEVYYKHIKNILDFKDGANLILNPKLETALLVGTSPNYGIEFSIAKTKGHFQGNANYTYSQSQRQVIATSNQESINNGNIYPSNFNQPNIVNVNWKYSISRRYFFTGNFTYRTGKPVTLPVSFTTVDGIAIGNYSSRNQFKLPDYHRLDLGLVIEGNHKRRKTFSGTWIISVINIYARKNAFTAFYRKDSNNIQHAYKMAILGTAIPSITYNLTFNDDN